jgi:hypothetical protein
VYKVYSHLKREADGGKPDHDIAKAQGNTAAACDTGIGSEQRIINESNVAVSISLYVCLCQPPLFVSATSAQKQIGCKLTYFLPGILVEKFCSTGHIKVTIVKVLSHFI